MAMVDLRLWQRVAPVRRYLGLTAFISAAASALIIGQAVIIAGLVAELVTQGWVEPARLRQQLWLLLAIALARAVLAWLQDRLALPAARTVIADLRQQAVTKVVQLGPRWSNGDAAETAISATQGLDALEPYLVKYLPSLLLTALVTPAALVVVGVMDWVALVICLVALPLVPVFMRLIGAMTAGTSKRRLAVVNRLGAQVLDLLTGLPTLKAFGREVGPGVRVRALGEAARTATMSTLRVAFLSSMVLELLTTIAVAMVAVSVGLRLVVGGMTLQAGLAVIMLAPEVFAPLRQVAMQFHASTDGLAATDAAFAILDQPSSMSSCANARHPVGMPARDAGSRFPREIKLDNVSVIAGDRQTIAPANLSARIPLSGYIVALVGPSGSGKSTTSQLILGLLNPDSGTITVIPDDGVEQSLTQYGLENWWRQLVWIPQRPALEGRDRTLSIGQRQRQALAEITNASPDQRLLILDEPTAHLDAGHEATMLQTLKDWRACGRSAIVIAHRPSLIALADQVIEVHSQSLPKTSPENQNQVTAADLVPPAQNQEPNMADRAAAVTSAVGAHR